MTGFGIFLVLMASGLGYIFIGGLAYGLMPERWADRDFYCAFWPIALVFWFLYQIATAGPRIIKWSRRPKLPKMRVLK